MTTNQRSSCRASASFVFLLFIVALSAFYVSMEAGLMEKDANEMNKKVATPMTHVNNATTTVAGSSEAETNAAPDDDGDEEDNSTTGATVGDAEAEANGDLDDDGEVGDTPKEKDEETKDCVGFDPGDVTPLDNVTSIFNCGSESGTCHWYYPAKFLDKTCGTGKEFNAQINKMKELYDARTLWLSGPPIVLPWARIDPEYMRYPNKFTNKPWTRHNLSMTHVHKTGGTSLVTTFGAILAKGARGKRHTVYMPGQKSFTGKKLEQMKAMQDRKEKQTGKRPELGPRKSQIYGRNWNESFYFLDGATKYKREEDWGKTDHTLFAVVRDPAERFISAIGQATGAYGSAQNGIGQELLDTCLKSDSRETLRCFINLMHTNSTWIEVHFTPMVLEISFATIYKDIPVAVFPFDQVPNLLAELGADPNGKRKDGHQKGYRKSDVLTNMTVADYDHDMMKSLCDVYKMDAIFLKHIGMSSSCDPVLDLK